MFAALDLSRHARVLAAESSASGVARRACESLQELLGADGGSVTVDPPAPYRATLHVTDERADLLENLHDVLGEGPGLDAFDSGRQVRTAVDRSAVRRWPHFLPAAAKIIGWDGMLWSIPMRAAGQTIGVVTLYRVFPEPAGERAGHVQLLSDLAASWLTRDPSAYRTVTDAASDDCWSSRAVVHQATGMLISQLRVGAQEALSRLRAYACMTGRRLTDVAADVVERRLDFSAGRGSCYRQAG